MKPFYITTSIVYPNARPHIGYAMELVQADFLARYYRQQGREVFFQTGTDVHGLKIQRTAEKQGMTAETFVDSMDHVFRDLTKELGLSNDYFIRTDEPEHIKTSQALWRMCAEKGDIYKKRYQAWYNVKEEEFLGMVDENPDPSVFGIDPSFIEKIDEENYFFRLSRYKDEIVEILTKGQYKVAPRGRLQELLNFVEQKGLQDVSISREKSKLAWGVPVPDDETQVMYVWYDALTNYLTKVSTVDSSGIKPGERWPADLHCIGKDIGRFHALLWTGMLLSAGLALPKEVLIHGFITSGGQKMSKSIGNVVDPFEVIKEYGAEPVRWYLLKEIPTTGDGDFTEERLTQVYSADLANDYGNLLSRVWTMVGKYADGKVSQVSVDTIDHSFIDEVITRYQASVENRDINLALNAAHSLLAHGNKRVDESKPWVLAKEPEKAGELASVLYELLEILRIATILIQPAMPETAAKALAVLGDPSSGKEWGGMEAGSALASESIILFPRRDS